MNKTTRYGLSTVIFFLFAAPFIFLLALKLLEAQNGISIQNQIETSADMNLKLIKACLMPFIALFIRNNYKDVTEGSSQDATLSVRNLYIAALCLLIIGSYTIALVLFTLIWFLTREFQHKIESKHFWSLDKSLLSGGALVVVSILIRLVSRKIS